MLPRLRQHVTPGGSGVLMANAWRGTGLSASKKGATSAGTVAVTGTTTTSATGATATLRVDGATPSVAAYPGPPGTGGGMGSDTSSRGASATARATTGAPMLCRAKRRLRPRPLRRVPAASLGLALLRRAASGAAQGLLSCHRQLLTLPPRPLCARPRQGMTLPRSSS